MNLGHVPPDVQEEFEQTKKKCFGFSYLKYSDPNIVDDSTEGLCFGWLITNPVDTINILTIKTTGGMCIYGPCFGKITIRKDGGYVTEDGLGNRNGQLSIDQIKKLDILINDTNFKSIRKNPFTGECPTGNDGLKFIYSFFKGKTIETLDSCVSEIDLESPLFKEVQNILMIINKQ